MNVPQAAVALICVALAVALGSLPTGAVVGRRLRGVDLRRLSPHNLGLGTVAALVGVPVLGLVVVLDLLKGMLAVTVAWALAPSAWTLAAASAGAMAGHAWGPFRFLAPPVAARLKGVAVASGTVVMLAWLGQVPWTSVAIPAAVGGGTLAAPRAFGPRWGYLSLAAVLAAASLPVALWALRAPVPYLVLALAYAVLTLWNHKEHLLRIADGVEPRLGERLPLPGLDSEAVCAFLIHPMTVRDFWEARRFRWLGPLYRRGLIPDRVVRQLARLARPMKVDDWHPIITADGRRARVYLIGAPLLPDMIRSDPALAVRRAVQAAHLASNLGATVLGLGAFWSVVGHKGTDVQAQAPIAITNGGAYTAGTVRMAIPLVLDRLRGRGVEVSRAVAAVVGANGVVGFGICRAVADRVGRLIMIGTDQERLERSRELLLRRYPKTTIEATTDLVRLRQADVIFTATSDPRPVIFADHVRPGCLLFDLGRPPDVDESVRTVPGVEVIPGGVVRLPGDPRGRIEDLGYGPGLVPACLAETIIIALDGCFDRRSLGDRTRSEDVDFFVSRASDLGFQVLTALPPAVRPGVPSPGVEPHP
ncbi:MAG: glycerol-3-phosphate acyltransferase [Armatimonadota bacterium]|nr:glycerol-3-phosphate acyltransferase [Armatimonadota bacterium]